MYNQGYVVAILVNGSVLREYKDVVKLPFGTEYTIRLINLTDRRALADISIDGQSISDGNKFVLNAGQTTDVKRFVQSADGKTGHAFRFIERTAKIDQHRGIKAEDGLVKVVFEREIAQPQFTGTLNDRWTGLVGSTLDRRIQATPAQPLQYTNAVSSQWVGQTLSTTVMDQSNIVAKAASVQNDAGITVKGSQVSQQFTVTDTFNVEHTKTTVILKLVGDVEEAVTVHGKVTCETCGTESKSGAKFCSECGTALT